MNNTPNRPLHLVLDTNVVLDWLVFRDTAVDSLRDAVDSFQAVVLSHKFAHDELQRVLGYRQFALGLEQQQSVMDAYLRQTQQALDTNVELMSLPERFPRCEDADDQPFLALCFHSRADALITRDKALLVLRRDCLHFGVRIMDYSEMQTLLLAE